MSAHGLTLYDYWRSSAAWRVRAGLRLKDLEYTSHPVHLVRDGGEQHHPDYVALNPLGLVPTLLHGDRRLTQSLAILEYLDEVFPNRPLLLPDDARGRARVRAIALTLAADTHPVHNLRVQKYLKTEAGLSDDAVSGFVRHWLRLGFHAVEALLADNPETGSCCHGDTPTLADCILVPAVYTARRFGADIDDCPTVLAINGHCLELPAFADSHPARHPDAEPA